jgi:hypothetical protein
MQLPPGWLEKDNHAKKQEDHYGCLLGGKVFGFVFQQLARFHAAEEEGSIPLEQQPMNPSRAQIIR